MLGCPQTVNLVAGGLRQPDAAMQEPGGVVSPDSALSEPVEGRLIARGRGDRSSRAEERAVHGDNLLRCIDQQPCRPEIVGQIVAASLQFGRQAAVCDQHGIVGRSEHHVANSTATLAAALRASADRPGAGTLGPITAATRQGHSGGFRGVTGRVRRYVGANTDKYHRRDSALSVAPRRNMRVASGPTPEVTRKQASLLTATKVGPHHHGAHWRRR